MCKRPAGNILKWFHFIRYIESMQCSFVLITRLFHAITQIYSRLGWSVFLCKCLGRVRSWASPSIKYAHNWPKSDFDTFCIHEVIFGVTALKFVTVGPFTRLVDITGRVVRNSSICSFWDSLSSLCCYCWLLLLLLFVVVVLGGGGGGGTHIHIHWWRWGHSPPMYSLVPCTDRHYNNVIMGAIASQITSLTIVYSTVYSSADQRKHQSSASLVFKWGIHRRPVVPRTNGQ